MRWLNDDIGVGEKLKEVVTIARVPQVEPGAAFAERYLRRDARFVPARQAAGHQP